MRKYIFERLNFRAISTLSTLKIKVFPQKLIFREYCIYLTKNIETLINISQKEYILNLSLTDCLV